jgi:hypothetical protein
MANIIIPGPDKFGKTRSEQEENLRKEWGPTITDEQLDKLKYAERKLREKTGVDRSFLRGQDIDEVR